MSIGPAGQLFLKSYPAGWLFVIKVTPRVTFPEKRGRGNKSCAARAAGIAETLHIPCRFQQSVDRTSRPTFPEKLPRRMTFFIKVTPRVIFSEKRGRENKSCAARAAGITGAIHIPCRFQQSVYRTSRPTFLEKLPRRMTFFHKSDPAGGIS